MSGPIDLADLLEMLGYTSDERIQYATDDGGRFKARVFTLADATRHRGMIPDDCNVWFGVNPVEQVTTGRPGAEDVTRLAGLQTDLDVKPRGCESFEQAHAIVNDLSGMLGTRPVAITYSGHGLQALWAVEDGEIDRAVGRLWRSDARALLRRWGRIVTEQGRVAYGA